MHFLKAAVIIDLSSVISISAFPQPHSKWRGVEACRCVHMCVRACVYAQHNLAYIVILEDTLLFHHIYTSSCKAVERIYVKNVWLHLWLFVTGYQGMFCGLNHPFLLAGIRMQVTGPLKISMI